MDGWIKGGREVRVRGGGSHVQVVEGGGTDEIPIWSKGTKSRRQEWEENKLPFLVECVKRGVGVEEGI